MTQLFVFAVAPLGARALVQVFGEGFRQPVRQRFRHDRVVRVVFFFKALGQILATMAGGNGKCADVINPAALARRDKVGERQLGLAALVVFLLA